MRLLAEYCEKAGTGTAPEPPAVEVGNVSRFFTRMLSLRLEMDIARQHPLLGMGYQLSGLYRKPLRLWQDNPAEAFVKVRHALRDPVPEFPYFCEYTGMAAELGFPGLLLFLLICWRLGAGTYRRYRETGYIFLLYMLFALGAFLLMLLSFALRTCYITYYFLGFLYAVGQARGQSSSAGSQPAARPIPEKPSLLTQGRA